MSKVKEQYQNKSNKELKEIYLSPKGWDGEDGESRTPFVENGKPLPKSTPMAYQQNGQWVIGTFAKYSAHLRKANISINQNSLTFLKLEKGDGIDEMNEKRSAIVNESSTTGTHTLYQNSFMKNVADYPVDGEYCHKSVYADNSVILMKLKRELLALSLKLSKMERNDKGDFAFLNSEEEEESLQPFTNAIITTLSEIGIHQNTTDDKNLLDVNIKDLVGDLFYNTANATDKTKAQKELSKELSELIKILLQPTTKDVFTSLSEYTKENQLATGFKEAIDKTKGELHTCYNLFVNEYGDEFTNKNALEQETMLREKSIMYPGATTQAGGYPDILFVGKNNKLVYAAPTKKGMTAASSFEGNQIVRHPLDIFYNMKECFKISTEDDISKFNWSDENIRLFKDYASNSDNWLKIAKGAESIVGGEHLAVLKSDQYQDFNLVSNQIFPFPTRSTVDKMFNEAGVSDISTDELGEIYAHIFGKISGYVLATNQSTSNAELMKSMSVANINETKMTFYKMLSQVGVDIESKLKSLFYKFTTDNTPNNESKLSGPQRDMLIIAGVIIGKNYSDLKDIAPDAGSDLTTMLKGMETEEAKDDVKKAKDDVKKAKDDAQEAIQMANALKWGAKTKQFDLMEDIPKLIEAYKTAKSEEAKEILAKMEEIYKPNTSKGDLLTGLREKYNTDAVDQSVKLSDTEELAEYVISMKFAEDMEINTVQHILGSNPLSDVFSQEETRIILTTIGERSKNKGNAKTGSHEPINFRPS